MLIKVRIVIILRGALTGRGAQKPFWAMETLSLGEWSLLILQMSLITDEYTGLKLVHQIQHKKIAKTIFKNYKPGGLKLPDIKTETTVIKKAQYIRKNGQTDP